ncbi:MAG: outer membrane protein transport protein [Paraglaciecola sp.]|uniref:outer membrane protein transport protein n=1 Tax=Paraglaciecola sp. TaxID=1920173 RepID=UPI0027402FC6|nr:outer membrane protein transport protein [Paraglaciecola sp.]MDP5030019.1 outer membrane protein transport protein [Paraglaciecola sp.]MDP5130865.1 outer membrane protein transport protein [Paraglaciecola sp.]
MFRYSLIAVALSAFATQSYSAAFQLAEHSASGLGRAFAGEAAIAENASVIARNPALMSQFSTKQVSIAATYVIPDVSLTGESAPAYSTPSAMNDDSIAPSALVPAAYFVMPIDNQFAFGLGLFSNFGLATEFENDYAAGQLAGKTEITTVNLNAALSYKVTEQFTVAAGVSYVYADAQITRHAGAGLPAYLQSAYGSTLGVSTSDEAVNLEGDDYGYGWNIGFAYELAPGHRLGLHYRAATDITFEGNYSNELPSVIGGLAGSSIPGTVDIELPASAEFSGSHQLNEELALHYSVLWTQWSSFESLEAYSNGTQVFAKEEGFKNAMRYALGADYRLNKDVTLRAGIAYDKSPADKHMSISIPDTNRLWLSTGANYALANDASIDVGIAYLKGEKQHFTEMDNLGGQWQFKSEGNAVLLSAQYNMSF